MTKAWKWFEPGLWNVIFQTLPTESERPQHKWKRVSALQKIGTTTLYTQKYLEMFAQVALELGLDIKNTLQNWMIV